MTDFDLLSIHNVLDIAINFIGEGLRSKRLCDLKVIWSEFQPRCVSLRYPGPSGVTECSGGWRIMSLE